MSSLFQLLFLAAILATSHGSATSIRKTILQLPHNSLLRMPRQIHLLRPKTGASGDKVEGVNCKSWQLAVETNNIINWKSIPQECVNYFGHYMLGNQYRSDSKLVVREAVRYLQSLTLSNDGKDVWVFDIDETTLSNLPYYAEHGFGTEPYNSTAFDEWSLKGAAPALPESLKLYKILIQLGVKVVFLTGRSDSEEMRAATVTNLKTRGYLSWERLILKDKSNGGKGAAIYKSSQRAKLTGEGYRIIGNIGDQWSDLLGSPTGARTFKLPDPMYYIG